MRILLAIPTILIMKIFWFYYKIISLILSFVMIGLASYYTFVETNIFIIVFALGTGIILQLKANSIKM